MWWPVNRADAAAQPECATPLLPLKRYRLVLVSVGPDETATPSMTVWWTGVFGEPKAGWVFPTERVYNDPSIARRLLVAAAQGLLVDREPAVGLQLLDRLATAAGSPASGRSRRAVLDLGRVLAEIEHHPGSRNGASGADRPVFRATGCPVVDRVLESVGLIGWCAHTWRELEESWPGGGRGPDGRSSRPLPPSWVRQLHLAGPGAAIDWPVPIGVPV